MTLVLCAAALAATVAQRGWITEDAFITFRTIENFLDGHGLRWNVDERVQVYTHPLWMLLLIPVRALFGELYWSTIALSIGVTVAAYVVAGRAVRVPWVMPIVLAGPLLLSKTVGDFATSGLEAPLVWLLCALLWQERAGANRPGLVALFAALLATTRHDAILLVAPVLALVAWEAWRDKALFRFVVGWWPLVVWEAFSLVYYGFLFPNTAWAKLASGVSSAALFYQGLTYAVDLLTYDPVGALLLLLVGSYLLLGLIARPGLPRARSERDLLAMAAGTVLSAVYVVRVGGDFMSGRFFAPAIFQAALVVHGVVSAAAKDREPRIAWGAVCGLVALAVLFPRSQTFGPGNINIGQSASKVVDERTFWSTTNGIQAQGRERGYQDNPASQAGAAARLAAERVPEGTRYVISDHSVGMLGYFGGPDVILLDVAGLADPLVARLPLPFTTSYWRPGHFLRELPVGYPEARRTGDTALMDPDLADYYAKIRIITSDPLFSSERVSTILAFNLGSYEHLRTAYLAKPRKR